MNYVLIEIKNFLKKLETGQLELKKDINVIKNSIQGLKEIKTDIHQMRKRGMRMTDLLKELYGKFNELELMGVSGKNQIPSCSSFRCNSKPFKSASVNSDLAPKPVKKPNDNSKTVLYSGNVKRHCSEVSIFYRQPSVIKIKSDVEGETCNDARQKLQGHSARAFKKLKRQNTAQNSCKSPSDACILQRYLKDSAKFINKNAPQIKCTVSKKSVANRKLEQVFQSKSFGDSPKSKINQQKQIKAKKFAFKYKFRSHDRIHHKTKLLHSSDVYKKHFLCPSLLKKYKKLHHKTSACFRGFRCSYCDKTCRSPDLLTKHMMDCRIISRQFHWHEK